MTPPLALQLRNRLNAAQNTKLENHKEILSSKQQLLVKKQRELEQLKRKQLQAIKQSHVTLSVTPPKSTPHKDRSPPTGSGFSTPPSNPPEHRTPSTSKKRYSSIFEAKHRQLREEEGLTFKESQARLHGDKKGVYTCCWVHTFIHAYIHTYIHTYIYTYVQHT